MDDDKQDITTEQEASPSRGGVHVFVALRSGHELELCVPGAVGSGGGSYYGREIVAVLHGPDRSTVRRPFASVADLLQVLGLPAPGET